jgi:hypothetical protein
MPHDRHAPVQAVRQQVPCSQKPLEHSVAPVQAVPLGFLPQLPPVQTLGATQSALVVQVTRQLPLAQVPAPSQARAGVNVVPLQVDAAQVLPLA